MYELIYKYNRVYGIRDKGGYVVFFPRITEWPNQQERYQKEIKQQMKFAEKLCEFLNQ